jgi:hypothetical protein
MGHSLAYTLAICLSPIYTATCPFLKQGGTSCLCTAGSSDDVNPYTLQAAFQ